MYALISFFSLQDNEIVLTRKSDIAGIENVLNDSMNDIFSGYHSGDSGFKCMIEFKIKCDFHRINTQQGNKT